MHLLTSIEGRISRQPFWIALVCLSVPELVAHFTLGDRWSSIVSLLIAYPEFAVFAKRGHDRNVPTWVAGVFIAGAIHQGEVPPYSVLVPGSLPGKSGGPSLYCAVIVKRVDEKTRSKTSINELLRD